MGIETCVFLLLCLSTTRVLLTNVSNAFEEAGICKKINQAPPHKLLHVVYGDKCVNLGTELSTLDALVEPTFSFEGNSSHYYTLVMLGDLDAVLPAPIVPITLPEQVLHWLRINIKGDDMSSGDEKSVYIMPTPLSITDHPYEFLVYKQKNKIDFDLEDFIDTTAERPIFFIDKFVEKLDLGHPIYGNYFKCAVKNLV